MGGFNSFEQPSADLAILVAITITLPEEGNYELDAPVSLDKRTIDLLSLTSSVRSYCVSVLLLSTEVSTDSRPIIQWIALSLRRIAIPVKSL